jgi:urea ABC transporter permease protein UrtB
MAPFVVTSLNALTLVSVLALVAIGLSVIYGLMNVINLAHGEFVTVGAYTVASVEMVGGNFWLGLVAAPIVGYLLGCLIESTLVRHLYKNQVATILATWGLSLILQQLIQLVFGAAPQPVHAPFPGALSFFGIEYPAYRIFLIAVAVLVVVSLIALLRLTNFGLDVRAVTFNAEMARSLGINTPVIYRRAFGLGAAAAALAGALIAPLTVVFAQMGVNYLARSFFVVTVGGVGRVAGVVAGSGLVGILETSLSSYVPVTVAQALVLAMAAIIMRFRPQGILPL